MITDQQISDMLKALESIVWAVRPDRIRRMTLQEQSIWKSRIMLEIITGERREP